jgi:hypothetical protein
MVVVKMKEGNEMQLLMSPSFVACLNIFVEQKLNVIDFTEQKK